MFALSNVLEDVPSPPLAPIEQPIDLDHLSRMTLGERSLEREVLELFDRQAGMLLARMSGLNPSSAAASAHTLKGSARGIGAWRVAEAAEAVECAKGHELEAALGTLGTAVAEVQAAIASLLLAR
jgi:HPt (histidine-containing phosphotransfer) domain-containing protein